MALRDTWHRALVYFGLAEDPDYHEPDLYEPETGVHGAHGSRTTSYETTAPPPPRASVSRIDRRASRDEIDDIFGGDEPAPAPRARNLRPVGNGGSGDVRVHLVNPHSFNDAQEVADRFKQGVPVILNLQTTEGELSKRLIDFASGLTYALEGGMQKVADKTFMLTPRNVEVSAEQTAQLVEKGFFNQS
jgi:cell division inhibitor SepF